MFERFNTNANQFLGTATESIAQRLSDTNISDDIADALNSSFPRASSVAAARAGEAGVRAYGYIPRPTIEGYTHTIAERINEARGMVALEPWERAAFAQCSVFVGGFTLAAAEAVLDLARGGNNLAVNVPVF